MAPYKAVDPEIQALFIYFWDVRRAARKFKRNSDTFWAGDIDAEAMNKSLANLEGCMRDARKEFDKLFREDAE